MVLVWLSLLHSWSWWRERLLCTQTPPPPPLPLLLLLLLLLPPSYPADSSGNIGYALVGRVPVRGPGCPPGGELFPLIGWTGENDWEGDTPWDLMPHSLNPSDGKIVSANHRIVPTTDQVHLGDIWVAGWRALAIHHGIDELNSSDSGSSNQQQKIGLDECQALQMDFRCIPGERLRDFFADAQAAVLDEGLDDVEAAALQLFVGWDGRMEADSVGATLYLLSPTNTFIVHIVFDWHFTMFWSKL